MTSAAYPDSTPPFAGGPDSVLSDTAVVREVDRPGERTLDEVVVVRRRQRYSKRNNPAVDFVRRLREMSDSIDPMRQPYYSRTEYERMVLGLGVDDVSRVDSVSAQLIDYSPATGNPYLTLSVKEKRQRRLHRLAPRADKVVVEGYRSRGVDEVMDVENVRKVLADVFRPVDLYGNDIALMQSRFVSPLSRIGPDFYKYYLTDTVLIGGTPCIELAFAPHNKETLGFTGRLYVPLGDTTMFVRKVVMRMPPAANINYVKELHLSQDFVRDTLGNRAVAAEQLTVELQLIPGTPVLYARREALAGDFSYVPDARYSEYYDREGREHFLADSRRREEYWWSAARMTELTPPQRRIERFMAHMRTKAWFFWGEKALSLMERGYVTTGRPSKFDLGPVNTVASYNDAEGLRLRLGGITTGALSPRWFARAYGAYGFHDRRWKYGGEVEYSFVDKERHSREFPIHSIRLSGGYDIDQLGQHYLFTNADNVFLSLKRDKSILITYRRHFDLEYTLERRNGFSLQAGVRMERQAPSRWLPFRSISGRGWGHYNRAALTVQLRYAPGEEFVQSASQRLPINMDAPIIILSHEFGPKGMLGADFMTNRTDLTVQKRFWLSAFGYTDVLLRGTKVWSRVYYPALPWANANLSYTIQPESFALLQPMEFANDTQLSWELTYWMQGLLFNRLPLLRKARLREVVSFRGFWGHLGRRNNPVFHPEILPAFPEDAHVSTMASTPYMELSAGIDNIFTILRVDYVWRLSYRDRPGTDRSGLRVSVHFSF